MQGDRWHRLQQLFEAALPLPAAQREGFIAEQCADDVALGAELARLLAGADEDRPDSARETIERAAAAWAHARRHSLAGTRLGAWRIVAHLADGGMGAVYRGERADGQYEQAVAVKLLNPAAMSPGAAERLAQERQILARLAHPHIARLLDGGTTSEGAPYLVMEFVDGEPIDAWCRAHAPDTATRLRLFAQVCRAVDHAHRNLVVHRDLKPSNILVDQAGQPRLLDFGIAKLIDDGAGTTRSGERVLTPAHASPEQITGGPITTAADVYALGVLLYDLLTGRLPHAESTGNPAALARAIVETAPQRPSQAVSTEADSAVRGAALQRRGERLDPQRLARELTGDLDNIVLMALRKEPERRYASAAELAADIERHLEHLPVHARADTFAYRSLKFWQRHPVAMPATLLVIATAIGAIALFTWKLADERDRALAAEQRARRVAGFTASVLENTAADAAGDRQISVQDLLDRATARLDPELRDEPEVAASLRRALARAYFSWGVNDRALELLAPALAQATARGEAGAADRADILLLQSGIEHDLGRLEDSLASARAAEALLRRIGPPKEQARALSDVALSLNGLRRRSEAEPVFREALALLRDAHRGAPNGDHRDIAWNLNNLAWCLHAMSRLDEAAPLYEEALAMQRRLQAPTVEIAQTLNNLAGVFYDRGDLDRAIQIWEEALAQFESVFGRDGHAAVARGQNHLATVAIDRGRFDDAERLSAVALAANVRLLGERHRWTTSTMLTHATSLLGVGRLDEAETLFRRTQALRRELLPVAHADHVSPLLGLARTALARGRLDDAERELRDAVTQMNALESPDRVPLDEVEWSLARTLALQGRREEGLAIAQRMLERMRGRMPATHWMRQAVETGVALPPFVTQPSEEAQALARRRIDELAQRLSPDAFVVRDLAGALAAVR